MTDALSDFRAFLDELGLVPRHVVADGKWHRADTKDKPGKKNGSWKLFPDGLYGLAQNHATMDAPARWRPGKEVQALPFDHAKFAAAKRGARRKMVEATMRARRYWDGCAPLRISHPYLEAHGLDMRGCAGLRTDREGWLIVPMLKGGHIVSLQRIAPDGAKRFWSGAPTGGTHYNIDRPGASLNVVCEGLATGLAIYAAVPTARVRVTFSAHGILSGAQGMPNGLTVIAADNDHETAERIGKNPGIVAAEKAAAEIGCGVAIPECGPGESDWCDLRQRLLRDRLAKLLPHERESGARRAVDAEIARAITRHAKFVSRVLP
jgi:putative DNA primase/helicase